MCASLKPKFKKQRCSAQRGLAAKKKMLFYSCSELTGVVAVTGVNDAKHVICSRLLFTVPVLVDEPGGAAPLSQLREHLSLRNTHSVYIIITIINFIMSNNNIND